MRFLYILIRKENINLNLLVLAIYVWIECATIQSIKHIHFEDDIFEFSIIWHFCAENFKSLHSVLRLCEQQTEIRFLKISNLYLMVSFRLSIINFHHRISPFEPIIIVVVFILRNVKFTPKNTSSSNICWVSCVSHISFCRHFLFVGWLRISLCLMEIF